MELNNKGLIIGIVYGKFLYLFGGSFHLQAGMLFWRNRKLTFDFTW